MNQEKMFSGMGGGGGDNNSQPDPPQSDDDNLFSKDIFEITLAVSEGKILGLATNDGDTYKPDMPLEERAKYLYLNDTPLLNADGTKNFENLAIGFYNGQPKHLCERVNYHLGGESFNLPVQMQLERNIPLTRIISGATLKHLNTVRLDVKFTLGQMYKQEKDGSLKKAKIDLDLYYKNDLMEDYKLVKHFDFTGKTMTPYSFEHSFSVANYAAGADYVQHLIKVVSHNYTTSDPDAKVKTTVKEKVWVGSDGEYETEYSNVNQGYWKEITKEVEVDDADKATCAIITLDSIQMVGEAHKAYPDTAIVHVIGIPNGQLSGIPQISGIYYGKLVKIPSNYDPFKRTYSGEFKGIFKEGWTNNPVWCLYDICMNENYGIKKYAPYIWADPYEWYRAAQWCDQPERNPLTGKSQPRFTFNEAFYEVQDIEETAQAVAGAFNAIVYSDLTGKVRIRVDSDETMPVMLFNMEVAETAGLQYSRTPLDQRYNDITVLFVNPDYKWAEDRKKQLNYTTDEAAIFRVGSVPYEMKALGCTDAGEALRRARYALISAQKENIIVSFRTDRRAELLEPMDTIGIIDPEMGWGEGAKIIKILNDQDHNELLIQVSNQYVSNGQFEANVVSHSGANIDCLVTAFNPIDGLSDWFKVISFRKGKYNCELPEHRAVFENNVVAGMVCEVFNKAKYYPIYESHVISQLRSKAWSSREAHIAMIIYLSTSLSSKLIYGANWTPDVVANYKGFLNKYVDNFFDFFLPNRQAPYKVSIDANAGASANALAHPYSLVSLSNENKVERLTYKDLTVSAGSLTITDTLKILSVAAVMSGDVVYSLTNPNVIEGSLDLKDRGQYPVKKTIKVDNHTLICELQSGYSGLVRVYYVVEEGLPAAFGSAYNTDKMLKNSNEATCNYSDDLVNMLKWFSVYQPYDVNLPAEKRQYLMGLCNRDEYRMMPVPASRCFVGGMNATAYRSGKISYPNPDDMAYIKLLETGELVINYQAEGGVEVSASNPKIIKFKLDTPTKGFLKLLLRYIGKGQGTFTFDVDAFYRDDTWQMVDYNHSSLLWQIDTNGYIFKGSEEIDFKRGMPQTTYELISRSSAQVNSIEFTVTITSRDPVEIVFKTIELQQIYTEQSNSIEIGSDLYLKGVSNTTSMATCYDLGVTPVKDFALTNSTVITRVAYSMIESTNPDFVANPVEYFTRPATAFFTDMGDPRYYGTNRIGEKKYYTSFIQSISGNEFDDAENLYSVWANLERYSSRDTRVTSTERNACKLFFRKFLLNVFTVSGIIPSVINSAGEPSGVMTLRNVATILETAHWAKYPPYANNEKYLTPELDGILSIVLGIIEAAFDRNVGTSLEGLFDINSSADYDVEAHYRIKAILADHAKRI